MYLSGWGAVTRMGSSAGAALRCSSGASATQPAHHCSDSNGDSSRMTTSASRKMVISEPMKSISGLSVPPGHDQLRIHCPRALHDVDAHESPGDTTQHQDAQAIARAASQHNRQHG